MSDEQRGSDYHPGGPHPGATYPAGPRPAGPTATLPPQPPASTSATTTAPTRRHQRSMLGLVAVAVVAGLVGGGAGFGGAYAVLDRDRPGATLTASPASPATAASSTTPGSVAAAAATAGPSTVDIRVATGQGRAEGSGIVLTSGGAVLTNNHVVAGVTGDITVTLADGTQHGASIVGTAPSYDLAVLRIDGVSGLTPAALGRSEDVQVGEQVVAIGSPQGLTGTVTTGIVSALDRTVAVLGDGGSAVVYNGLQTDAPINQGNSGGPLVNLDGQVVGVNSAIATATQSSGSIGLGFAIPVDQARRVAQEILDTGRATKPVLGVRGSASGSAAERGATIAAVEPGSAAADAGLAPGETVLRVGDATVGDFADLIARIGAHAPGETVPLTVAGAGGTERTVDVALGSTPDEAATTSEPDAFGP